MVVPRDGTRRYGAMRALAFVTAFVAVAIVLVASTTCSFLSVLDDADFDVEPVIRGDLRPLFTSPRWWLAFPCLRHWSDVAAPGPALVVGTAWLGLVVVGRRWSLRHETLAALSLAIGALPYAIGAVALRDNVVAQETGAWLVWMLAGPLWAAVLALGCLVAPGLGRMRSTGRAPVPGHA